jgi:hypothetical protein
MRDGFVFYRSFREAIRELPEEERLKCYEVILDYALDEVVPNEVGISSAIFKLIKPQIDANNKRYENGKKGGRGNRTETKPKPNTNQDVTNNEPKEKEKEKVKEKDKDKVKVSSSVVHLPPLPPIITLPCKAGEEYIVTQGEYEEMTDTYPTLDVMGELRAMKGWLIGNKNKLKLKDDIPKFMYGWLNDERKKKNASLTEEKPKQNKLGVFGDYKQSSTDEEWDELGKLLGG